MRKAELLEQVQRIIRIELDQPAAEITNSTVVDDLPDWDSIAHVQIIVATERLFGITFDTEEYTEFADIGEMIDCIARKLSEKATCAAGPGIYDLRR